MQATKPATPQYTGVFPPGRHQVAECALLLAISGEILRRQPLLEGGPERRPFAVDDGKPGRISIAALVDHELAEGSLVLESEPGGSRSRRSVEAIALPFVAAVAEFVEHTPHHQEHRLGGSRLALQQWRVVDVADLDHTVRAIDAHVGGEADGLVGGLVHDRVRQRVVAGGELAQPGDIGVQRLGGIHAQIGPVHTGRVELVGGE
jgi:hypothetical protein